MAKKWMKRLDKRWTYKPGEYSDKKFRLSRGAIEEYLKCKRCFYLYRKMGLKSAPSIPFVLNMAVDNLFKNEFDIYRRQQSPHPLMKMYGIDAVPYQHHELDAWRENFKGISVEFLGTDIEVFGAVDDIWVNTDGNLIVVDYKATAKSEDNMFSPINSWDNVWNKGVSYKRQLEIYQWLLFKRGFQVSKDCYLVLGVIHELWRPVTGSFDDYISSPKDNLYQSLHTVVINDQGQKIEFQIRTDAMHLYAEDGMASHWKYKNTLHDNNKDLYHDINWTQNLLEWETEIVEDSEYLESVNNDILSDKVIVNSPKNEVFTLPIGSTPLDYAYRLHTDLGHSCQAAFVNGVLVPLNKKLNNGDTVQIQKSDLDNGPSLDWLNENLGFIATANARNKVKSWFKKRERTENIKRGKDQILSNIRLSNIETSEININDFIDKDSFETFAYKVGTGEVNNEEIINLINQQQAQETVKKINSKSKNNEEKYDPISSIVVMGGKDFQNKIANCCEPVYGDEIVGYKLSSNEVIIHRIMCSQLRNRENTNRFLVAAWGHSKQLTPTKVMIEAYDRMGLIRDITDVVWGEKTNLHSINSSEDNQNGTCKIQLTVYTRDLGQIIRLLGKMEKTPGVYKVSRIE